MGLDAVELVMAVEEVFDIETPDDEADKIRTPRQLREYVASKVGTVASDACLTQRAFYRLRKVFREHLEVPRRDLRPDTRLARLLPRNQLLRTWEELRTASQVVHWPTVKLTQVAIACFWTLCVVTWAATLVAVKFAFPTGDLPLAIPFLVVIPAAIFSWRRLDPFRTRLTVDTLGGLAEFVAAYDAELLAQPPEAWTEERVRLTIRKLVSEQLGIGMDFDENADFVNDLGLG